MDLRSPTRAVIVCDLRVSSVATVPRPTSWLSTKMRALGSDAVMTTAWVEDANKT